MLAGLAADPTPTVPPFIYFPSKISLAIPQYALFFSERFSLLGRRLQELAPNLVEFIAYGNEFTLDRIRFTIECLLHLAQAESNRYALPSPIVAVQMRTLIVACPSKSFYSPRTV